MSRTVFDRILAEFKAKEVPEAILVVGEDLWMTRLALAWPYVSLTAIEPAMSFSKHWSEVGKWNWLWRNVRYSSEAVFDVAGRSCLDNQLYALIANRILYPDGTVHSYVTRFLRDRVVKLLEKKPPTRRKTPAK